MTAMAVAPLLALVAGLAPAQVVTAADALATRSRRANELMAAGRYLEAAGAYRRLVAARPGDAGLLMNLGMSLQLAGRSREAVEPLQQARRRQPDLYPAALFLGAAYLGLGEPGSAVEPLRDALKLRPAETDAASLLAEALLGAGYSDQALPLLQRLSADAPGDPKLWFAYGSACLDVAGRTLDQLQNAEPSSPYTLALAAESRAAAKQHAAAVRLFRGALQSGEAIPGLHAALAAVCLSAGRSEWAATENAAARQEPPANCERDAAACAFAAGELERAITIAAGQPTVAAAYWRARACRLIAARAGAELASLPPSAVAHEWRARELRDARRYAESAEEWRQALALAPTPGLQMQLALTLRQHGDLDGARQIAAELLRKNAETTDANALLGDILLARQQPESAVVYLRRALAGGGRAQDHAALGRAYALLGRSAEAIPHLRAGLESDDDGSLHLQLARACQAVGREADAKRAFADYEAQQAARRAAREADAEDLLPPPQ
jgi:predicted Zn-dependent protease